MSGLNIYQKLIEVRKMVPYLQKENAGQQYKYVSSSQVLSNCKVKMDELGLLLIPAVIGHKVTESIVEVHDQNTGFVTKRTTTYFTELDMSMTWVNAEKPDETIACTWYGQGVDIAGEKGVGKAMTYAEKYFMLKFFNIPTDKDDPDSFQGKLNGDDPAPRSQQRPQSAPPQGDNSPATQTGDKASDAQLKAIFAIGKKANVTEDQIKSKYKLQSMKDISKKMASTIIEDLQKAAG